MVKNLPANWRHKRRFNPGVRKIPWEEEMTTHSSVLPGKAHGQRSLVGYSPRGPKDSDTTEHLNTSPYITQNLPF